MKNPWSDRWNFVKHYIPDNVSVVDFGCGNKEALDHIQPTRYLGIDCLTSADLVANLDEPFNLQEHFDVGLLLGVLEYVADPYYTLNNIVRSADHFVVLSLPVRKKSQWQRAFTESSIDQLLCKYFSSVTHHWHGRYILSVCRK